MLQIILLLMMSVSVLSLPTEGSKHKDIINAAEPQSIPMIMTDEHEKRSPRLYQLMYPNPNLQHPRSQIFRSGGFINNIYYPPIQGEGAGSTGTKRNEISSIYRFLYPDQIQRGYSGKLPVQTLNPESDTKVQASSKDSQIPNDESMTVKIKPTNLLSPDQIQQELLLQNGRAGGQTQLNVPSIAMKSQEESKDQQIMPANLLSPDQKEQELLVQSGRADGETQLNVQAVAMDSQEESKDHQIKLTNRILNPDENQQGSPVQSGEPKDEPQPSEEFKPKISSASSVDHLSDTEPSSALSENKSPAKVENDISDQISTTVNPQLPSTADTILSEPTHTPIRKHQKKHHKDEDIFDEIFDAFFSSEEI